MKRQVLLIAALAGSFLAGRIQPTRTASADAPNPCPKYQCVMAPAWWDGNGAATVHAMYSVPGFVQVPDALEDYFAPTSGYKLPTFQPGHFVDYRSHPGCFPTCGKVGTPPVWQAPQQVITAGPPSIVPILVPATLCTITGQNENAPQSDDQSTQPNPGWPPGVPKEAPPAE